MSERISLPDLFGAQLGRVTFNWSDGSAQVEVVLAESAQPPKLCLHFRDVERLIVPRQNAWRETMSIKRVHGPFAIDRDVEHLRIEMQSEDVIEFDYRVLEMERSGVLARIAILGEEGERPSKHAKIPHLHDVTLMDLKLHWETGVGELVVGPMRWDEASQSAVEYLALRFSGVRRLVCPRRLPWDYFSTTVLETLGPIRVDGGAWHLRLFMQDGDVIEIDYESCAVESIGSPVSKP